MRGPLPRLQEEMPQISLKFFTYPLEMLFSLLIKYCLRHERKAPLGSSNDNPKFFLKKHA